MVWNKNNNNYVKNSSLHIGSLFFFSLKAEMVLVPFALSAVSRIVPNTWEMTEGNPRLLTSSALLVRHSSIWPWTEWFISIVTLGIWLWASGDALSNCTQYLCIWHCMCIWHCGEHSKHATGINTCFSNCCPSSHCILPQQNQAQITPLPSIWCSLE